MSDAMPSPRTPRAGEQSLIDRVITALVEYDDALCGHAAMIARKEKFTRAEGWDLVERMREKHGGNDLLDQLRELAAESHVS